MRRFLHRHPLVATVGVALLVALGLAVALLPRLDGLEVMAARAESTTVAVAVRYRLQSAAIAVVTVEVLAADGNRARTQVAITAGDGETTLAVPRPAGADLVAVATLQPAGASHGWLAGLLARRCQDARRVDGW